MSRRHELTDEQWARVERLLPPEKPETGHPNHDHRTMINGMVWIVRTGAPWRDLPERYGNWSRVHSRFRRWHKAGVWDQLWATLKEQDDAAGQIDWEVHFVDGTIVRAIHTRRG